MDCGADGDAGDGHVHKARGLLDVVVVAESQPLGGDTRADEGRFDLDAAGAKAFADFMVSKKTQQIIKTFGVEKFGSPLFFPDAGKKVEALGK